MTWGVFRRKNSDKIFIVLNTHLDWLKDPENFESRGCVSHYSREMQVRQLASTFVELQMQYPNADILLTGDWNTLKGRQPLTLLSDLVSVKYAQDVVSETNWGNEVDHIFVQEKTKVKSLYLYRENSCDLGATDHPWGFADIE